MTAPSRWRSRAESDIDAVVATLHNDDYIRIDRMDVQDVPTEEDERGFRVRY